MSRDDAVAREALAALGTRRDAVEARRVFARVRSELFLAGSPTPHVGRYEILRRIGAGGMGVVYAARDPALQRDVAIKLVRVDRLGARPEVEDALRGEARTLASFNHPNIVRVFEAGVAGDRAFVVMEFVAGISLRKWLRRGTPRRDEIIAALVQAGRGLAAAHAAGIVHRDFKPENVLIDSRGVAKVADFGLARSLTQRSSDFAAANSRAEDGATSPSIAGTPAYGAPEVVAGQPVTARSDQFSYCVAVHETLLGFRPGEPAPHPRGARLPPNITSALDRGLSAQPDQRFASMDDLLAAIESSPRRHRWWGLAAVAATAAAAAAWSVATPPPSPCANATAPMQATWNAQRRAELGVVWAQFRGGDRMLAQIDDYALRWGELRQDACRTARSARTVTSPPTEECFENQRADLAGVIAALRNGPRDPLVHPAVVIEDLAPPSRCMRAAGAPAASAAWTQRLAQARSALDLHHYDAARDLALEIAAEARQARVPAALAESLLYVGQERRASGEFGAAQRALEESIEVAEASRSDAIVVEAIAALILVLGEERGDLDEALGLARRGEAALRRVGSPPRLAAPLALAVMSSLSTAGDHAAALHRIPEVVAAGRDAYGDDEHVGVSLRENVAVVRVRAGDFEGAKADLERVLEARLRLLGPNNPGIAQTLTALGAIAARTGEYAEAVRLHERAVEVAEATVGDEHRLGIVCRANLAVALIDSMRDAEARPLLEAALERERKKGAQKMMCTTMLNLLGLRDAGRDLQKVSALAQEATEVCTRAAGPSHYLTALVLTSAGFNDLARGELDSAQLHLQEAGKSLLGSPLIAFARAGMARVHLARGDATHALLELHEALKVWEGPAGSRRHRADARFLLAKAMWKVGEDRVGARCQAERARAELVPFGQHAQPLGSQIDAWLADRTTGRAPSCL